MTTSRTLQLLRDRATEQGVDFDTELKTRRNQGDSWTELTWWIRDTYTVDASPSWVRWIHDQI